MNITRYNKPPYMPASSNSGLSSQPNATPQDGSGTDSPSSPRSLRRINGLSAHFYPVTAEYGLTRDSIERQLKEKVLLFQIADHPEDVGLETTEYDANFNVIPDGLRKKGHDWKNRFIESATRLYCSLKKNETVFATLWHPNMYGGDITHVSVIMIGKTDKGSEVIMAHHESVPVKSDVRYVDGRMPGSKGILTSHYDCIDEIESINGSRPKITALPLVESIKLAGWPNVNFLTGRNFEAAKDYIRQLTEITHQNGKELDYAAFVSNTGEQSKFFYPSPPGQREEPGSRQINTCYSLTTAIAFAAETNGSPDLTRTNLHHQGEQMCKTGMLSNTTRQKIMKVGISEFKKYTTEAGINTRPDNSCIRPCFDLPGDLLLKQKEQNVSLDEYNNLRKLEKMRHQIFPSAKKAAL